MIKAIKYNQHTNEVAEYLKFIKSKINGGVNVSLVDIQSVLEKEGSWFLDGLQMARLLNLGEEEYKLYENKIELIIECKSVVDRMLFFELNGIQEEGAENA